jgi:xanthosine utilization system XapX-like protein
MSKRVLRRIVAVAVIAPPVFAVLTVVAILAGATAIEIVQVLVDQFTPDADAVSAATNGRWAP